MAGPFNLNDTSPSSSDFVSAYPLVERTFRGTVNDWLTFLSDPSTGIINLAALPPSVSSHAPIETVYTASGTHTFDTNSTKFQIIAVGAGGGGGGADGQGGGTQAAGTGGGSGFAGVSSIIDKAALLTGAVVIGTAGTAGAAAAGNGGNGGDTTWTDTTNTLTFGGGKGGGGSTGNVGSSAVKAQSAAATSSVSGGATIVGGSVRGLSGDVLDVPSGGVASERPTIGGSGGDSPYGTGGLGPGPNSGQAVAGAVGTGYGVGGSGALSSGVATNAAGGAGTAGLLIVREW